MQGNNPKSKFLASKISSHPTQLESSLVLWQLERHENAIASFDRTIQIRSDKYQSWYFQGWALLQLQRNDEANAYFDKVIQIKPDYKLGWLSPE